MFTRSETSRSVNLESMVDASLGQLYRVILAGAAMRVAEAFVATPAQSCILHSPTGLDPKSTPK